MRACIVLVALIMAGCVNVDPNTGETLPRGKQRYKMATVERHAEQLKTGMTKYETLMLLGAPAESSDDGDVWVYLPEMPAVLVPSRALRLVFEGGMLVKHEYSLIVLGQPL